MNAPHTPAPAPRLDAIGLTVSDMAASLAFYRLLGLELPADADTAPHVEAALPGGLRLLFDTEETVRSYDPDWTPSSGDDRAALAFRCATPAEVDSLYTRLTSAGHRGRREPWDAVWGQRYALLLDPDGGTVQLFADR
ncbi:VOC family protein [Streptomyces sp. NPDC057638]|uniref:VOC family protein n=1 Tax=Streptomyces sp. NPDC057638 TaxID=3346190 RepID=UPI0036C40288